MLRFARACGHGASVSPGGSTWIIPPRTSHTSPSILQTRVLRTTASPSAPHKSSSATHNWSIVAFRSRKHFLKAEMATTKEHTRSHGGHSHHGHGHSHGPNLLLLSADKKDAGVRITRIGLYVNLGMAIGKGIGGWYFNSQALSADAIHSLTDLVSDVMTLATVSWSLKTATERFPSGYGKIESLGSLGVSGILLGGGFMMGWAALVALGQQFAPDFIDWANHWGLIHAHGHSHSHSHTDLGPNINAAWLAAGSIVIKEWLYRATMKIAREKRSTVLAANAYHHRVDSLTAFVALLMIGGSNVLHNASWLDPVGGLVISLMVIQAGWGNTMGALLELADVGVDAEMRGKVRSSVQKALDEKVLAKDGVEIRNVSGVKSGQNYLMDVELATNGSVTLSKQREMEGMVRDAVGKSVRGVRRVRVHFVPVDTPWSLMDDFVDPEVAPSPSAEDANHSHNHDHEHEHANGHSHKH